MRVATILAKDVHTMQKDMDFAYPYADLIELRLDSLEFFDKEKIFALFKKTKKRPVILTLRRKDQGGFFSFSEEKRIKMLLELIAARPDFLDLEFDVSKEVIQNLKKRSKKTQIIGSFHDLKKTPDNLGSIFSQMKQKPFDHFKIVTTAHSSIDVLKVMHFLKRNSSTSNLSCMCTNKWGEISRIMAKACGSKMVYGYVNEKQITGQLSLEELEAIYHIPSGKDERPLYCLIGEPVDQSVGHIYHNRAFQKRALYVKIPLLKEQLAEFFSLESKSPLFSGMSVTTPLKEEIIPYLDTLSEDGMSIQAINTISLQKGKRVGDTTDGRGALDAIQNEILIDQATIAIMGTGPTARSIYSEALKRNAHVTFFSRDHFSARKKSFLQDAIIRDLSSMDKKEKFDIFIDATGTGIRNIPSCYEITKIPSCKAYMHLSLPSQQSLLYEEVQKRKGRWILGETMFVNQAKEQQRIWVKQACEG